MIIPASTLVIVADAGKALIFRNRGDALSPALQIERVLEAEPNPPAHEQGAERPGRVYASVGTQRSAVEVPDPHERAEARFIGEVSKAIEDALAADRRKQAILVAPPRTLGLLRQQLSARAAEQILSELPRDLTKHPVRQIELALELA